MCVCDIACLLNMTQSAISHQLRVLASQTGEKPPEGKIVFYSLDDEHIEQIFELGLSHILEDSHKIITLQLNKEFAELATEPASTYPGGFWAVLIVQPK